jgi:hypothetical protein
VTGASVVSLYYPSFPPFTSGSQEIIDFFFNWDYVQTPVTHSTNPSEKFNKVTEAIIFK